MFILVPFIDIRFFAVKTTLRSCTTVLWPTNYPDIKYMITATEQCVGALKQMRYFSWTEWIRDVYRHVGGAICNEVGWYMTLADPRGGARDAPPPPRGSKFFHFHAVFGKKLKNNSTFWSWRPPPPGENPGSATAWRQSDIPIDHAIWSDAKASFCEDEEQSQKFALNNLVKEWIS